MLEKQVKLFDKFINVIMIFTSILLYILGFINLLPELPDNVSNTTILLFVMAFGLHLVSKDNAR